jgi:hypothetical protein
MSEETKVLITQIWSLYIVYMYQIFKMYSTKMCKNSIPYTKQNKTKIFHFRKH